MMRRSLRTATKRLRRRYPTALLLGLALAGGPAWAEGTTPSFSDVVDVRVVNLEIVATSGGRRVQGLRAEDFELRVDGRRVSIDYFSEITDGSVAASPGAKPVPSLAAGEAVGTRYVVFIDDYFAIPTHRDQVLKALRGQVDRLAPEDRMAVVAFDGRRIDLITGWTRSPAELTEAFDEAMDRTAYGLRRRSELRRWNASNVDGAASETAYSRRSSFSWIGFRGSGGRTDDSELEPGLDVVDRVSQVVRAAAATLRGFSQPSERKVMLLLTGGWPSFTTGWPLRLAGAGRNAEPFLETPAERLEILEPLIDTANRLGFTLYPVDLQPFSAASTISAELSTAEHTVRTQYPLNGRQGLAADSREALSTLADATGGRTYEAAAGRQALARTVEDTRSYYWLGFTPRWQADDTSHRVEVRVRRRGVRARSRTSFHDPSRESEMELLVEGALLFDQALPGENEIEARLGTPQRSGRGRLLVPLHLEIPLAKLTLVPGKDGYRTALEVRVAARDEDGFASDVASEVHEIRRPAPPEAGAVEVYEAELKLRAKRHRLIVTLYEPSTGTTLSKRLELDL